MLKHNKVNLIAAACCLLNVPLYAQELVQDGNFEAQSLAEDSVVNSSTYWNFTGTAGIYNPTAVQYANESTLGNLGYANSSSVITQDLGVALESGKNYQLSMIVGWRNDASFSSFSVGLRVNGTYLPVTMSGVPTQGQLATASGSFIADASHQALIDSGANIILELTNPDVSSSEVHFDNVSVVASSVVTDSDSDGMTDSWELQYSLNPNDASDASQDLDGDNSTNLAEFNAGTDPSDNTSYPSPFTHSLNGNTEINGALRLLPSNSAPLICDGNHQGSMYYDSALSQLMICDGISWSEFEGKEGPQGVQGEAGVQGIQGIQGIQGTQGIQGDVGPQGIQGLQGIQGVAGTTLWTDGTTEVTTSVNVGIGTNSPAAALEVIGNAIANPPTQTNHLVTKGYTDSENQNIQGQVDSLLALVNQLRTEVDLLNTEVFPPPPPTPDAALIPVLSSNNSAAPIVVSASSVHSHQNLAAWKAFNKNTSSWPNGQCLDTVTGWLEVDFGSNKTATSYVVRGRDDALNASWKNWVFQGSNDGANWADLDTQASQTGWSLGEERRFYITPSTYRYFRWNVLDNNVYVLSCSQGLQIEGY